MGNLLTGIVAQPQFIAYAAADLPALAPSFARRFIGLPLLALDNSQPSRAGSRDALCRPDYFRGLCAVKRGQEREASIMTELRISVAETIGAVATGEWDACANPQVSARGDNTRCAPDSAGNGAHGPTGTPMQNEEHGYNPFISHAFLSALENQSVGPRTGWQPQHVLAHSADGSLVAAAPAI